MRLKRCYLIIIWEDKNMRKAKTTIQIYECGAMAIVRVKKVERAYEIAQACINSGINVLEISYTNNNASSVIEALHQTFKEQLIVGAGTVLDAITARFAILSGAEFIIAPNFNEEVALMCNRYQIPYAPGCTSVSEAVKAMEYGAAFVKAFPISDFYHEDVVRIFKTPIPDMPLLASGGITLDNIDMYIQYGCDCLGFGGLLTKGTIEEITANARIIRKRIDRGRNEYR